MNGYLFCCLKEICNTVRDLLRQKLFEFENTFFSKVIRHALGMMIPFVLVAGVASAIRDLPIPAFQSLLQESLQWLYLILNVVGGGFSAIFSLVLVITLAYCFAMEKNESFEYAMMYVIVSLGAFVSQLDWQDGKLNITGLGTEGCFCAIFVTYLVCMAYAALRKNKYITLQRYTAGVGGICAPAIQALLPMALIIFAVGIVNRIVCARFHVEALYEVMDYLMQRLFEIASAHNSFLLGLIYIVAVQLLWFLGFHGSNVLNPVTQTVAFTDGASFFLKNFSDTFVSMGGSGTAICIWLALILFMRKKRNGKLAGVATIPVLFNMNEILTFGIPIILNPVLFLPFVMTPVVMYMISYIAVWLDIVPAASNQVAWTMPPILSGYVATGSIRGAVLQIICIVIGVGIYLPFLKLNEEFETVRGQHQLSLLVEELKEKENDIEHPMFLLQGNSVGIISRTLLQELKSAIQKRELYMLYQPQIDANGKCVGAEANLRWNHPVYGMIYPPLIIYLAEDGGILPELEDYIVDTVCQAIQKVKSRYHSTFKISVNFTAHSLLGDIESCIHNAMKKYDVRPEELWIEITEQDVLLQVDTVTEKMKRLRAAGHKLLIDDFGMGHTSLLYLNSHTFDIVKLDGSLVRDLLINETNQTIVRSIVELTDKLGMSVIAEFVETEEQKMVLEQLGCRCYQGHLYSKPVVLESFIAFLNEHNQIS